MVINRARKFPLPPLVCVCLCHAYHCGSLCGRCVVVISQPTNRRHTVTNLTVLIRSIWILKRLQLHTLGMETASDARRFMFWGSEATHTRTKPEGKQLSDENKILLAVGGRCWAWAFLLPLLCACVYCSSLLSQILQVVFRGERSCSAFFSNRARQCLFIRVYFQLIQLPGRPTGVPSRVDLCPCVCVWLWSAIGPQRYWRKFIPQKDFVIAVKSGVCFGKLRTLFAF